MRTFFIALVLSVAAVVHAASFPSPDDWRNENIYFIFTDRFSDGDPSNNNVESGRGSPYAPSDSRGIHGGDFKGIQQKLDYIQSLGASAIWITPIPLNVGGNSAYHGYAAQDFYTLAPHWGTMTDLSNMVAAAHARGIKVILDVVVNHSGDLIGSTDPGYPAYIAPPAGYNMIYWNSNNKHAPPFLTNSVVPTLSSLFHTNGAIGDAVLGELSGLDDFRTETTYVRTNMMNIYTNWVGRADLDGFRVDTAKHVDYGFWQYWCPQLHQFGSSIGKSNFFMFGEAFDGSESLVGSYTGTQGGGPGKLDSMLDYPLYFTINPVFATASGNTKQIEDHYNAIAANYDTNAWYRLVTFLDNHDNARFLSPGNANNDTNRLTVALEFLYTSRGIPTLYYGTEQAFDGSGDPNNREDMFAGQFEQVPSLGDDFNETHPLFQLVAKLNNFRRLYPSLRRGVHNNLSSDPSGPGLFAYSRVLSNEEVLVVFNTAGVDQTLTNCATTYSAGTVLVNLLSTNETVTVISSTTNVTPQIIVPSMTAKIFIAQSLVLPLDPVVVSQSPSHAASCISTSALILLQFSKPMDTNSVQAAFSVTPARTGTFTWNTTHDTMTFSPGTAWPVFATNLVHLATNAVDSVSGNSFCAPFDTYFVTFTTNTINTSSSPAGGGTTSGGGTVNCGSNVTVCATPNACYSFLYWTRNGSLASTSACYTFPVTGNETLVAGFVNGQGALAIDNAADQVYSGTFSWTNTVNGGTGFSPWTFATTTPFPPRNCNGFFISSSTLNPPRASPGIDVNGQSWGIFANSVNCGGPTIAAAYRAFAIGPVQVGGQLLLDMDNGANDMAGSAVGFTLRNGDATNSPADYTTGARLQFYLAGGSADYTIVDAAGARDSGVPLTYTGMHLIFAPGTNDSYTLTIITLGSGSTNTISGTLGGTPDSTLDSIALFNNDNGADPPHDVFFNSLSVADFTPITYTINISSSPAGGGTTSGGSTVNCGSNVTVCATPNSCYSFVNWTLNSNVVSTSACYTFTADGNHNLVANFAPITYSISASSSSSGAPSISGGGIYNCGATVTVCAVTNTCYTFVNWTENGSVVYSSPCYSFTANTNRALVANYLSTDTVGDGISDCWRQQYFGGSSTATNSRSCATCDSDGTGQNNLFKYVAGLDPTNSASVFILQTTTVPNQPTQKTLTFSPLAVGRTYTPQFTTDLVSGVWLPLTGYAGPVTNGSQVTIIDMNAVEPQKFYRIKISLAQTSGELQAYWTFDEGTGSIAYDYSGNGNTGTVANAVWIGGLFGSALLFDDEEFVSVPNSPSLNPVGGITVSAWIYPPDTWSQTPRILQKGLLDNQYRLFCDTSLKFDLFGVTNGTVATDLPSPGSWHHVAGTYNGSVLAIYVDGQLAAQQSASGPLAVTTDPLNIASKPSGSVFTRFNGNLDDVRIYGRALTASEIAQLYQMDTVGDGVANWWRQYYFGNATGTDATSCATCDFDGTGQNNFFKYVTGLNPTDPTQVFTLQIASVTNQPNQMNLTFTPVASGRTYAVQSSTNVTSGVYSNLTAASAPQTNGSQVTVTDQNASQSNEFYRIHISLP